jgi:hypothetical protein
MFHVKPAGNDIYLVIENGELDPCPFKSGCVICDVPIQVFPVYLKNGI